MRDLFMQVYKEAADTELAKKGHAIGSQVSMIARKDLPGPYATLQVAKEVHKTAGVVAKTDVGKAVKKVRSVRSCGGLRVWSV